MGMEKKKLKKKIVKKTVAPKKAKLLKVKTKKNKVVKPKPKPKKVTLNKNKKITPKVKKTVKNTEKKLKLKKSLSNPIMKPRLYSWESQAVFNPAAIYVGGRVHLFYRALGNDGISRFGYASSKDGINFDDRLFYPVYFLNEVEETKKHWPYTSPARPIYDTIYASGGGWGGCEDPRTVIIDGVLYMTFNVFNGWGSMRVAVVSIKEEDLLNKKWIWQNFAYLSKPGDRQKNWVLFPEKFNGKFAIFHNLDIGDPNRVGVTYVNKLDHNETPQGKDAPDPQVLPDNIIAWHKRTRSAASPPIKTKDGWLLLYHAMDKIDGNRYKLGAMLLDLYDPSKVICRAQNPILEPDLWYENDWKPGIIYASGAVIKDDQLYVYYGGGDKYVGVASIKLETLIKGMKENATVKLTKNKKMKIE
jgi:predicted GH43/DUF377 family glycosyl hydrolase